MILHTGERVFWGAPEVIYLEGTITKLDEATQTVVVHIERATPHSAHLIGSEVAFTADGIKPLEGDSPPGTTNEHTIHPLPPHQMSDDDKFVVPPPSPFINSPAILFPRHRKMR